MAHLIPEDIKRPYTTMLTAEVAEMLTHYFESVGVLGNSELVGDLEYLKRSEQADSTGRHVPENAKRIEATQQLNTTIDDVARDVAYPNSSKMMRRSRRRVSCRIRVMLQIPCF